MKYFLITIVLFLSLVSCSKEELIVEPILPQNILDDEVYGKIDQTDFKSYVRAFIKDAERHGVVLKDIDIESATLELLELGEPFSIGAAPVREACNPQKVYVIYNKQQWADKTLFSNTNHQKFSVIWHELGHSILGLTHTCTTGHIMTAMVEGCAGDLLDVEEVNIWGLTYNNEDKLRNFQRAVDDMFAGYNQYYLECRTSFTSKGVESNLIIN